MHEHRRTQDELPPVSPDRTRGRRDLYEIPTTGKP